MINLFYLQRKILFLKNARRPVGFIRWHHELEHG